MQTAARRGRLIYNDIQKLLITCQQKKVKTRLQNQKTFFLCTRFEANQHNSSIKNSKTMKILARIEKISVLRTGKYAQPKLAADGSVQTDWSAVDAHFVEEGDFKDFESQKTQSMFYGTAFGETAKKLDQLKSYAYEKAEVFEIDFTINKRAYVKKDDTVGYQNEIYINSFTKK